MRLYFPPEEMQVNRGLRDCRDVDGGLVFSSCTVNTEKNYIEFVVATAIEPEEGETTSSITSVLLESAVDLPMTIAKAEGIRLTTSGGEERET